MADYKMIALYKELKRRAPDGSLHVGTVEVFLPSVKVTLRGLKLMRDRTGHYSIVLPAYRVLGVCVMQIGDADLLKAVAREAARKLDDAPYYSDEEEAA